MERILLLPSTLCHILDMRANMPDGDLDVGFPKVLIKYRSRPSGYLHFLHLCHRDVFGFKTNARAIQVVV